MVQIQIEANTRILTHALQGLAREVKDLRPALGHIGEAVKESTQNRILAGGPGPDGQAWPALSPAYLLQKKGPGLLRESGQLLDSITWKVKGDQAVAIGSNKVYAAIHQFGGTIKKAARSGTLRLRTDAKGNLLRQGSVGRSLPGPKTALASQGAVFARKAHKRFVERHFTTGAHTATVPARPFLGLSGQDETRVLEIIREHLRKALEA